MKISIDRIEEEIAIIEKEDGQIVEMPKELIPIEAKEGDILSISVDTKAGINRRQEIESIMEEIWEDKSNG